MAKNDLPKLTDHETVWSAWIAQQLGGEAEYHTPTGRRVDVMLAGSNRVAIEVDWLKENKPAEAIGQALGYAVATGASPAVVLLSGSAKANEAPQLLYWSAAAALARVQLYIVRCYESDPARWIRHLVRAGEHLEPRQAYWLAGPHPVGACSPSPLASHSAIGIFERCQEAAGWSLGA